MTAQQQTGTFKISVDGDRCMGHAMCNALSPDVYEVDDDGFNVMGEFELGEDLRPAAQRGAQACPERAITLSRRPAAD
ncbi:ferredoxin [Lentzea sp. NPDC004789]